MVAKSKKVVNLETRITLLKTRAGAFVYTFKRKPSKKVAWEFGVSWEDNRDTKKRKRRAVKEKVEPSASA